MSGLLSPGKMVLPGTQPRHRKGGDDTDGIRAGFLEATTAALNGVNAETTMP